jgi:hypothetical protein
MNIMEVDEREAHSAVNMNNRKIWHSRMGHIGKNHIHIYITTHLVSNSGPTPLYQISRRYYFRWEARGRLVVKALGYKPEGREFES